MHLKAAPILPKYANLMSIVRLWAKPAGVAVSKSRSHRVNREDSAFIFSKNPGR